MTAEQQFQLAVQHHHAGRLTEAANLYRQIPSMAEAQLNLGSILLNDGKLDEAFGCFSEAIELKPNFAEAHSNLGNIYRAQGKLDDAVNAYHRAISLKPEFLIAHNNLGVALTDLGKMDEAIAAFRRVLEMNADYAQAYHNLGNIYKDQGLIDDALACHRRAVALKGDDSRMHSNLLYALHLDPRQDASSLFQEHYNWARRHADPLKKLIKPHTNSRVRERRLKIGYVSPDLTFHPVGRFLLPLMEHYDRTGFEVTCYSDVRVPDQLTQRLSSLSGQWRNIVGVSDDEVAQMVRNDGIDILIDLAMHFADNRLLLFARKPAPVQASYLAYCSTTGLDTIDYRFTDAHLDPPGSGDAHYSEKSFRLESYWCHWPCIATPDVGPLPAATSGRVTFGCLNNFAKASAPALALWCQLLHRVPHSRLILHAKEGSHRQRVFDLFKDQGLDPQRLRFLSRMTAPAYFAAYQEIDICLDPFPCGGGTTTCDALWAGVPVVSLAGRTAVGRAGASILNNAGMAELVAQSEEQYVQIAAALAADLPRLASLRAGLRKRLQRSPLMNAARFTRNLESAYRQMWHRWCDS